MSKHESPSPDAAGGDAAFLARLGLRLRHLRALRGMSRKVLARTSGISERYLAQVEAGQGNGSVILLRRAALAMGCALEDLVDDAPGDWRDWRALIASANPQGLAAARAALAASGAPARHHPDRARRVALIGLRGAGKSTLGRLAAERLGWPFVELNREIEAEKGFSIAEIFAIYGQDGYRRQEEKSLRAIIARSGPMVLATGGGIVAEAQTFDLLLANFSTVWVKAAPADHMARVRAQGDLRPMANDRAAMAELTQILASRAPLYARARAILDTSGAREAESLETLLGHVAAFA